MTALDDVTVLDVTQFLAGPFASMMLGDLGAEVIKIENPDGGDLSRGLPPHLDGESAYHVSFNRNKKSMTLDLASDEGREVFLQLAEAADVVLENFRAGTMDRFGLGYETVSERNGGVVYCSISGFGETGPYSGLPAADATVQAFSGSMSITGPSEGKPYRSGVPIGDIAGSMYAVQSVLAALYHRERTGRGQYIDVALADGLISWLIVRAREVFAADELPGKGNNPHDFVPYGVYETRDLPVFLSCIREHFWRNLCEAIDRPELPDDDRFETLEKRRDHRAELDAILEAEFETYTAEELVNLLGEHDVMVAPINDLRTLWEHEQVKERDLVSPITVSGNAFDLVDYPVKFSEPLAEIRSDPPRLGEDTERVLRDLGYDDGDIRDLREDGVV